MIMVAPASKLMSILSSVCVEPVTTGRHVNTVSNISYRNNINYKKVLLRERKRHTARSVEVHAMLLCWGGGGTPAGEYPLDLGRGPPGSWMGYPWTWEGAPWQLMGSPPGSWMGNLPPPSS